MPGWIVGAVRTALQVGYGIAATWLIAHNVPVPKDAPEWLQLAALAAVTGAITAAIQWAERRAGGPGVAGKFGTLVRWLARIVMLGTRVAAYPKPPPGDGDEAVALLRAEQAGQSGGEPRTMYRQTERRIGG